MQYFYYVLELSKEQYWFRFLLTKSRRKSLLSESHAITIIENIYKHAAYWLRKFLCYVNIIGKRKTRCNKTETNSADNIWLFSLLQKWIDLIFDVWKSISTQPYWQVYNTRMSFVSFRKRTKQTLHIFLAVCEHNFPDKSIFKTIKKKKKNCWHISL